MSENSMLLDLVKYVLPLEIVEYFSLVGLKEDRKSGNYSALRPIILKYSEQQQ